MCSCHWAMGTELQRSSPSQLLVCIMVHLLLKKSLRHQTAQQSRYPQADGGLAESLLSYARFSGLWSLKAVTEQLSLSRMLSKISAKNRDDYPGACHPLE